MKKALKNAVTIGITVFLLLSSQGIHQVEGATYPVTNTNNLGLGSLRQALLDANANPGLDTITFSIPGTGVHTIQVRSIVA